MNTRPPRFLLSVLCRPSSALRPLSSALRPPSSVVRPLFSVLCLLSSAVRAHAADKPPAKITVQLDWVAEPEHGGFYQAEARGFQRLHKRMGDADISVPRQFDFVFERDSEGYYAGSVPQIA